MDALLPLFPPGTAKADDGMLLIDGCRADALATEFGTPVMVVSESALRARAREYADELTSRWARSRVVFASKAFPCTAVQRVMVEPVIASFDVFALVRDNEMALRRARFENPFRNEHNRSEKSRHQRADILRHSHNERVDRNLSCSRPQISESAADDDDKDEHRGRHRDPHGRAGHHRRDERDVG